MKSIRRLVIAGVVCVVALALLVTVTSAAAVGSWQHQANCYGSWPYITCLERDCYVVTDGGRVLWMSCTAWSRTVQNA